MSTLLEKLDKEELLNSIQKNSTEYHKFIQKFMRNDLIIPDTILKNYFKDNPSFYMIQTWLPYAKNLLKKEIEIPEIVLKVVSKTPQYCVELIFDFLSKNKKVPEVLIKSISLEPNRSYWVARRFIEHNKKVPEILNQSIAKEPMLLQTYKQFLREIEVEKKVKEAYASKEEVDRKSVV